MRTTLAALTVATATLAGLGALSPANGADGDTDNGTTRQRGYVLDCTGTLGKRAVYASLYENNLHGHHLQVVIGDDDDPVGNDKWTARPVVTARHAHGALKVGGKRAVVDGDLRRAAHRTPIHEEYDDAGQHIVDDGYHRAVRTDLTLRWNGRTTTLTCDDAFYYHLTSTRTTVE